MIRLDELNSAYPRYLENRLVDRFFKHRDLLPLLEELKNNEVFHLSVAGYSFEQRPIFCAKAGKGDITILLWSQMHGDEPTATMALFDLFNFLKSKDDGFDEWRNILLERCTLVMIPMLNPDGAERFSRYNAQGIDINRDFHRQQSPEGRILRAARTTLAPQFGFNLHDQLPKWSAGSSGNPATLSLLAPPADAIGTVSSSRMLAFQLASAIAEQLDTQQPGHLARFDDTFEPRAFGDNFQAAGTSTVLIEAGSFPHDPEKQHVRRLVFLSLVTGLSAIASGKIHHQPVDNYHRLPQNEPRHADILLKNCTMIVGNRPFQMDIALMARVNVGTDGTVTTRYVVGEMGDLSGYFGYETIDGTESRLVADVLPERELPAHFTVMRGEITVLSLRDGRITKEN